MSDYAGVSIGVRVGLKTLLAQMTRVVEFLESSAVEEVDYEEVFREALYKALDAPCQNVWKPVYKWSEDDFQSTDIFRNTRFGSRRRTYKMQSFPAFYRMYTRKNGSRPLSYVYKKYMAARVNAM